MTPPSVGGALLREIPGSGGPGWSSGFPPGYGLVGYGRMLDTLAPAFHILERPDRSPVETFSPSDPTDLIERAAWRDHRRRTLRVVRGGKTLG